MAVQISDGAGTPHATNYSDLLAKLKTFLLANGWVSVAGTATEEYLKGTGSGSDNIFVGIQKFADAFNDNYAWILQGYTGYVGGAGFNNQPGAIPTNQPALPLWNNTIPYWFVASGRRFIVVAKVSTLYMSCYCGYIIPYAVPASQWPYALAIGGSTWFSISAAAPFRYSNADGRTSLYCIPLNEDGNVGQLLIRDPAGSWRRPLNISNNENTIYDYFDGAGVWPWTNRLQDQFNFAPSGWDEVEKTLDGNYTLQQAIIHEEVAARNIYGELDGVFHVGGRGQSAENIVVRAGVNHLVIQNIFRTTKQSYAAIKLA